MTKVTQVTAILLMLCGVHNGLCLAANPAVGEEGWKVELNPYDCKALKGGGPVTFTATATCYGTEESTFLTISWAGAGQAGGPATATSTYITITIPANTPGLYTVTAIGECKKADGTVQNLTATATLEVAEYKVAVSPGTVLSYDTTDISSTESISWQVTEMTRNGVVVDTGASAHFDFDTGQEDVHSGYPYYVQWKIDDDPWVVREKVWPCDLWLEAIFPHDGTNGGKKTEPDKGGEEAILYPRRSEEFPTTVEVRARIDASQVAVGDRPTCAAELTQDFSPAFTKNDGPDGGVYLRTLPASEASEQDWDVDGDQYMWLDGYYKVGVLLEGEYTFDFVMSELSLEIDSIVVVKLKLVKAPQYLFCYEDVLGAYPVTILFEGVPSRYNIQLHTTVATFDWKAEFDAGDQWFAADGGHLGDMCFVPEDDLTSQENEDGLHKKYTLFVRHSEVEEWDLEHDTAVNVDVAAAINTLCLSDGNGDAVSKAHYQAGFFVWTEDTVTNVRLADKDVKAWTLDNPNGFSLQMECRSDPERYFWHHSGDGPSCVGLDYPHTHAVTATVPGFTDGEDVHDIYYYYNTQEYTGIGCKLQLTDNDGNDGNEKYTAVLYSAERAMYCAYSYAVVNCPRLMSDVMDADNGQCKIPTVDGGWPILSGEVDSGGTTSAEVRSIAVAAGSFVTGAVAMFFPAGTLGALIFNSVSLFLTGEGLIEAVTNKGDDAPESFDYVFRGWIMRTTPDHTDRVSPGGFTLYGGAGTERQGSFAGGDAHLLNAAGYAYVGDAEKIGVNLTAMITNESQGSWGTSHICLELKAKQKSGAAGSFPSLVIAKPTQ